MRVSDIPPDLKDPEFKDDPEMRTAELFRFCLDRQFLIRGFDQYGFIELRVDDDRAVKRSFGLNSIWLEPQHLELVSKSRRKLNRPRDFGWKVDFLEREREYQQERNRLKGKGEK